MWLILTPLSLEQEFLHASLTKQGWRSQIEQKGRLRGFCYPDQQILLFCGGHGKAQFAVQTQFLLNHYPLNGIFCVGAAGSLTKSVKTADLVIAQSTVEHDYQLKFIQRPLPEFNADASLLERTKSISDNLLTLHWGKIASGDEDVIDASRALELSQQTQALAVAWEGAGGARAAQWNQIPFLEVRAITDGADSAAVADFRKNLEIGMTKMALFFHHFFKPTPSID